MVKYGFLHVHSHYSLHDSPSTPDEIVKRVKELGGVNVTLTDHGTVLGNDPFMEAGKKYGVNTIPGIEAYLKNDTKREHFIIFAKNYDGYRAIWKLLKKAEYVKEKNRYYTVFPYEILEDLRGNEDIVTTSACMQGPIAQILLQNHWIEKSIQKERGKANANIKHVEEYEKRANEISKIDVKIKELREEKKNYSKYTTKAYENRIKKKKDTLKKKPSKELEEEIQEMEKLFKEGNMSVKNIETEIKVYKVRQKEARKERDSFKNKYNAFLKSEAKIKEKEALLIEENVLYQRAVQKALFFKELFPNFFIELQYHGIEEEAYIAPKLLQVAKDTGIPTILANDAHMIDNSEKSLKARQILRFNYFKKHEDLSESDKELYLKTDEELLDMLSKVIPMEDAEEALSNLSVLGECKVIIPEEKHYPKIPDKISMEEPISKKKEEMIKNGQWDEEHEERLKHELKIIKDMGYEDYHMVVRDFCIMAKKLGGIPQNKLNTLPPKNFEGVIKEVERRGYDNGVGVGPGRGSAVGSLVCYMLGITNIDPLKYGLIFERYLNPERVTMPDIDSDIKRSIRPLIIRYLKWRYGENAVCSIVTEGTYAVRAALQMAGRDIADEMFRNEDKQKQAKLKSQYMHKHVYPIADPLDEKINSFSDPNCIVPEENTESHKVWDNATLLEGKLSHTGIHAGGVVISDNPDISDYIPVSWAIDKSVWAAQCDMVRVEEKGFLKMDVLGLNTLDIISDCMQLVTKDFGIKIDIDDIPFESEVFEEIYAKGNTNAIFQFESGGMKRMLTNFKPETIEDIILLVAAYRPGPMQYLDNIIEVKNGRKKAQYLIPELEPILKNTYGAIIYQEQVMKIFQSLAGYSLGNADIVRRYMSKKKEGPLKKERESFINGDPDRNIEGCVKRGISKEKANQLFDEMMEFAKYAFNKSHACAYAIVSYQTAYLKYHYPRQFLCAVFNNVKQEKYGSVISDCKSFGINILPPTIKDSMYEFITEAEGIRFGFRGIKGIADPEEIKNIIVATRGDVGIHSMKQYIKSVHINSSILKPSSTETLIDAGCFDVFWKNREELKMSFKSFMAEMKKRKDESEINELLDQMKSGVLSVDKKYNRQKEAELLGALISENPLDAYSHPSTYACSLPSELKKGQKADIFGYIDSIKITKTKKGNDMGIINMMCTDGPLEVLMFGDSVKEIEQYQYSVAKINGEYKDGKLFGRSIQPLRARLVQKGVRVKSVDEAKFLKTCLNEDTGSNMIELIILDSIIMKKDGSLAVSKNPPRYKIKHCSVDVYDKYTQKFGSKM